MATLEAEQALGRELPMMISMTLTDLSGRNLSGHTVEAFWASVRHARPVTIGLNCSFGAAQLRPHLAALAAIADTLVMAYPNAGLPNELGEYDEARSRPPRRSANGANRVWSTSSAAVAGRLPRTSPQLPGRCAIARRAPSRQRSIAARCWPGSSRC